MITNITWFSCCRGTLQNSWDLVSCCTSIWKMALGKASSRWMTLKVTQVKMC